MRGETNVKQDMTAVILISIHSPHARGDMTHGGVDGLITHFNPLPSCEGRRRRSPRPRPAVGFQSTPLMRGETDALGAERLSGRISIHSPHARGDMVLYSQAKVDTNFNPLPSCEGRQLFRISVDLYLYFNPLPSCEGRQHKLPKNSSNSRQFIQHNSFYTIS